MKNKEGQTQPRMGLNKRKPIITEPTKNMESKNIVQYIILAAVAFLSIVGIVDMLKPQTALSDSKQKIDSVLKIVTESKEIIRKQMQTIDQMQKMNTDLYVKVQRTDSINKVLKSTMDTKFSTTNKSLKELKQEIENIQIPDIR
jgi:DNA-binding transcriptional regulator YbjK